MQSRDTPLVILALFFVATLILTVFILTSGCISGSDLPPAASPTDTITILPSPSALPEPTFMALTSQYTPVPAPAVTITPQQNQIIGSWVLVISPNPSQYTGNAQFYPDGTGSISGGVLFPEETQRLIWNDTGIYNGLTNFEAYNISVGDQNIGAVIGPSGHLTSDLLPDGAYLARE